MVGQPLPGRGGPIRRGEAWGGGNQKTRADQCRIRPRPGLERGTQLKDYKLYQSEIDVNSWAENDPSTEAVRPRRCPKCGVAAGMPGSRRIHGHGRRVRQQWGPGAPGAAGKVVEIWLRRFRCLECNAVMTVGPRGVLTLMRYSAAAIALALLLWQSWPQRDVRTVVSPWRWVGPTDAERWRSLGRWAKRAAGLWRLGECEDTPRRLARRVCRLLEARGPPECASGLAAVWAGAQQRV